MGVDARAKGGWTPLHGAAYSAEGDPELVRLLLRSGAPADARDEEGYTPLLIAVEQGDHSVARMLLQRKANPNVSGPEGKTPLAIARTNRDSAMEKLLKSAGARS